MPLEFLSSVVENNYVLLTLTSMEIRMTSDLFKHRYYRINAMILKWLGHWPYQKTRTRFVRVTVATLIFASIIVARATTVVKHLDDWNFLIECIIPISFDGVLCAKFWCSTLNSKKMLMLLDRIRTDWDVLARDRDVDILHEYAETGRKLTILYADLWMLRTVVSYATCVLFATQPIVSKIIDVLLRNGTEPGEFPFPVDYLLIDAQKYYFYLIVHSFVGMSAAFIVLIAHDTLFIVYILHGCGLYAVLGHKLERIGKDKRSAKSCTIAHALDQPDMDFEDLVSCIDRHNKAIEYAELIEATYSWCFFFVVAFNMFLITITGLQIVVATIELHETLRFVIGNVVATMLLYAECYLPQILMDSSIIVRYYILNSEWYKMPLKTQKILLFIIIRCNVPCTITAGKVFIMSMEMFNVALKTSLSYFSFLRSM